MAPSLVGITAALLLLSLRSVSAAIDCATDPSPPSNAVCGVTGSVNTFAYFQVDLFDSDYLTPEACADACASHAGCSSFYLNSDSGGFCELHSADTTQTQFVADSTSFYDGYDISCFVCTDSSTSTSTTSSQTSTTTTGASNGTTTDSTSSQGPTSTISYGNSTITTSQAYTTSTVCTTVTSTISSCQSYVTDCPYGSVTTKTIPLYTTTCPITAEHPKPTTKPAYTTSSVYATTTYVVTKCPAAQTKCPYGSTTTQTQFLYTTVCSASEYIVPTSKAEETTTKEAESSVKYTSVPVGATIPAPVSSVATYPTEEATSHPVAGSSGADYQPSGVVTSTYSSSNGTATYTPVQVTNAGNVVGIQWTGMVLFMGLAAIFAL